MLTIAGGIVLGVIALYLLRFVFCVMFRGPDWRKGIAEGFRGFKDGLRSEAKK